MDNNHKLGRSHDKVRLYISFSEIHIYLNNAIRSVFYIWKQLCDVSVRCDLPTEHELITNIASQSIHVITELLKKECICDVKNQFMPVGMHDLGEILAGF